MGGAELLQRQEERLRAYRQAEADRTARDQENQAASSSSELERKVERWAAGKDLHQLLGTLHQLWPPPDHGGGLPSCGRFNRTAMDAQQ